MMLKTTLAALAVLSVTATARAADDIEGPRYDVVADENGVELREYAPHIVAEVTVEAPSRDAASSRGFRPLAGYIFGGNSGSDEIAMTAPVTTGTKIAMTAPVTTGEEGEGTYTVRFSMPRKWTMETLPVPNDPSVTLTELPAETRLAYRWTGEKSSANVEAADAAIRDYATRKDLILASPPIVAGYDGPSVPPSKRRWEVMRIVEGGS